MGHAAMGPASGAGSGDGDRGCRGRFFGLGGDGGADGITDGPAGGVGKTPSSSSGNIGGGMSSGGNSPMEGPALVAGGWSCWRLMVGGCWLVIVLVVGS